MAETTADKVADYIIKFSHDHGDPITNLKLQKLLYYAQAWHLALYDKPLFDENFEAWVHGPVLPSIYRKYKHLSWNPINTDPGSVELPPRIKTHLDEVMAVYGGLNAWELERTAHQEEPWMKARGDRPRDVPSGAIISKEDMRLFYRAMANDDQATAAESPA